MSWCCSELKDCRECQLEGTLKVDDWGDHLFEGHIVTCLDCGKFFESSRFIGNSNDWKEEYNNGIGVVNKYLSLEEINEIRQDEEMDPIESLKGKDLNGSK